MLNPGEFLGTGPDKHDVARFLHNPPGCSDRVFNDGDTTNGTGHPRLAIHDGCVEFCLPVLIQYGSFTRIEQRAILHKTDNGLNGIQTATTVRKDFGTCFERFIQLFKIGLFFAGFHAGFINVPGSAMNDQHPSLFGWGL